MEAETFQFSTIILPYLSQKTIDMALENVNKHKASLEKWLSPYEATLMKLQSLLVWENPLSSLKYLNLVIIAFW